MRATATPSLSPTPPPSAIGDPLRVALVCDWYLPRIGGIERQLAALAGELVGAGHRVTVVTPMPGAQPGAGVALRHVATRLVPGATVMWSPRGFRALGEVLRSGEFDLIHVHSSTVSPAAFGAIYHAQRYGRPTVATMHSIPGRFRPLFGWLHRRFRWGDWRVVYAAVSHRVGRELQPFVPRPIAILPNAIDPRFWHPRSLDRSAKDIAIACVMRLVPRKRGEVLLDAFCAARAAIPAHQLTLNFVGDGPSRRRLERRARAGGVANAVQFHGSLPPEAIRTILARSNIFALPCPVEAFGIAALEGRAMGLPVLAMSATGVSEFIASGRDGLLANTEQEFAEALLTLCRDNDLRWRIIRHNREVPVACTWEVSLARHLATYEEARLLARSTAPTLA